MFKKIINLPNITLLTALSLSSVAAWFAIAGLVAIFPAKATAIMIMGAIIEIAKIVATVWLRKYWHVANWQFKALMIPMVVIAMILTSLGTFGFLSGAHSEHSAVSGDVSAKVAIIDEKIKTQRDNIEVARKALSQMDAQVDARLSRGDSENSAERAVTIRRQQAGERSKLQKEISDSQKEIAKLNEERAPIASQLRKVETEIGPIKYIAAMIYGDNPDTNTLEKAVRWVIIMLVLVFDPFAISLVLAGNASKTWEADENKPMPKDIDDDTVNEKEHEESLRENKINAIENSTPWPSKWEMAEEEFNLNDHPYLFKSSLGFKNDVPIQVYRPEPDTATLESDPTVNCNRCDSVLETIQGFGSFCANKECITVQSVLVEPEVVEPEVVEPEVVEPEVVEPEVVEPEATPLSITENSIDNSIETKVKDLLKITPDHPKSFTKGFGSEFPKASHRGDVFIRIDTLPNTVYKYDGRRWNEISKEQNDVYLHDESYIEYLIQKIDSGEYDVELLTEVEKDQIRSYLKNHPWSQKIQDSFNRKP